MNLGVLLQICPSTAEKKGGEIKGEKSRGEEKSI